MTLLSLVNEACIANTDVWTRIVIATSSFLSLVVQTVYAVFMMKDIKRKYKTAKQKDTVVKNEA